MTDNEIIKTLNEADGLNEVGIYCADCEGKYIAIVKVRDVIDLINSQKAEIERLQAVNETLETYEKHYKYRATEAQKLNEFLENKIEELTEELQGCIDIKNEAIKEFAERLKKMFAEVSNDPWNLTAAPPSWAIAYDSAYQNVDDLLEEMEQENER